MDKDKLMHRILKYRKSCPKCCSENIDLIPKAPIVYSCICKDCKYEWKMFIDLEDKKGENHQDFCTC